MSRVSFSDETPVKLRPAVLWALLGAAAMAGASWAISQTQISNLKEEQVKTNTTVSTNAAAQSADHDLLVRIDERTAQMQADQKKILDRLFPPLRVATVDQP